MLTEVDIPPIVELIYAGRRIAGLNAMQCLDEVPYSWLLRFRTQLWYLEGLGASKRFKAEGIREKGSVERMLG